jgi:hypothetical protein
VARHKNYFSEFGSGCGTRAGNQFGYSVTLSLPHPNQQYLRPGGIFEDVEHVVRAIQLKKSRASSIRTRRRAGRKEQTQFRELLRCMTPEVFEKRRLFCAIHGHDLVPPHIP